MATNLKMSRKVQRAKALVQKVHKESVLKVDPVSGQLHCTTVNGNVFIVYQLPANKQLFCYDKVANEHYCNL